MHPPDMIIAPFFGRKALPGQEGEVGPDGPHGGWSEGFFSTLLEGSEAVELRGLSRGWSCVCGFRGMSRLDYGGSN